MAWGSTQEAAALFSVIHLFPNSQLEEVGLCWVDPASHIPPSWGFLPEDLPPLGASPDGLIRHKPMAPPPPPLAITSHPVLAASEGAADSAHGSQHSSNLQGQAQSGTAAAQMPGTARTETCLNPLPASQSAKAQHAQHAQSQQPQHAQQPQVQATQVYAPSLSELEVLLAKLDVRSKNPYSITLQSASSLNLTAQTHAALLALKPQPDVLSTSTSATSATPLSASAVPFASTTRLQESATAKRSNGVSSAVASSTHGGEDVANPTPSEQGGCQEGWLEAVEIKNVCPFRETRNVSSSGKSRRLYRLSDPGPYSRVCHHVQIPKYYTTSMCHEYDTMLRTHF